MNELSTVDEIGCYFDRPAEPNDIHLEAHLPGRLDHARLREAITGALAAHPRARVRRAPTRPTDRRYRWQVADAPDVDPLSVTRWETSDELSRDREEFLAEAPSIDMSPPVRLRLASGPDGDVLLLSANHAALDGVSCIRLIRAIAREYTGEPEATETVRPAVPDSAPVDPPAPSGGVLPVRPARIAARTTADRPGYGFQLVSLARPAREARKRLDPYATVNDLLIAAFGLAVARWNTSCGRPAGTVQVTMPINARTQIGDGLGNLSRLTAVTIAPEDRVDPARLVARVAAQTRAAKSTPGSPIGLMGPVMAPGWLPVAVKRRIAGPLCRLVIPFTDTAKVSNWGHFRDPLSFGDAGAAHGIWVSGPAPMPRGLSLTIVTVGDRLHLTFRHRHALFDTAAAQAFTDTYLAAYDTIVPADDLRVADAS